ncbi:MAG: hypothetical protein CL853_00010 [Crocinitomicaceae bacterium]|nr:hypothetical protein [Crocinitomicaceae bacterium]
MDFIKESILTFSEYDRQEFIRFLSRKRPSSARKDVEVFKKLYINYTRGVALDQKLKGDQNYHAIRKRISKEIEAYLMLKSTTLNEFGKESKLLMIQYFIQLNKYKTAWELLEKEEKKAEKNATTFIKMLIQRMKLQILPFYSTNKFKQTQEKLLSLQNELLVEDQFQLYYIQVQKELNSQLVQGEVKGLGSIMDNTLKQYKLLERVDLSPKVHLKIIEIIRTECIIKRRYFSLLDSLMEYYQKVVHLFENKPGLEFEWARLEYIMAHAFFNVRKFPQAMKHLTKVKDLMHNNEAIKSRLYVRYISIESSIEVYSGNISAAIDSHEKIINTQSSFFSEQERLNLELNLVAYYCTAGSFGKANKILIYMNKASSYYQNKMGREWLLRKEMIRVIAQIEIGNIESSITILKTIKAQHKDMLELLEYRLVVYFVELLLGYLKDPFAVKESMLDKVFIELSLDKKRIFEDPKLLAFYSWLKSKITNKKLYSVLLQEYNSIN